MSLFCVLTRFIPCRPITLQGNINAILAHPRPPSARFGIFRRAKAAGFLKIRTEQGLFPCPPAVPSLVFSGKASRQAAPPPCCLPPTLRHQPSAMQPIKPALPNRTCKTTPRKPGLKHQSHAMPQPAGFYTCRICTFGMRASRARGKGKDFDLCKMGVYLGVYPHV